MAFVKEGTFFVRSRIDNLDESGLVEEGEELAVESRGFLRASEDELLLTYTEGEGENKVFCQVAVRGDAVCVNRRGATDSVMHLEVGKKHTSIYKVPPYSFDMEVEARKIRNSMTLQGGRLDLFYDMCIGGQKKRVRLSVRFEKDSTEH